jgi:putative mRNA 3-end processing factor
MLLQFTSKGIYCQQAGLYIDPWQPVGKAIITHAHSDHARTGSGSYLAHHDSARILKYRLGDISLQTLGYHESIQVNGVDISLHPAGHIIGSAQVRLAYRGEVWVVSGDYKVMNDGYTVPFEPVPCQHFITESTFGLPVYNFPDTQDINRQLNDWVRQNAAQGLNSVITGYALGKAQRILRALDIDLPIVLHNAIYNTNEALGFDNSRYIRFSPDLKKEQFTPGIILATDSAVGSPWLRRFLPYRLGICSGWMQLRGARRRRNADKGFVMSDHADWKGLNEAVRSTGAEHVYVTHGYRSAFAHWLREQYGLDAVEVETNFEGETNGSALAGEDQEEPA